METRSPDSDPPPPTESSIRRTPKRRRITSPDAESQSTTKIPSVSTLCSPSVCLTLAEEARSLTTAESWESSTRLTRHIDTVVIKHVPQTHLRKALSALVLKYVIKFELRSHSLFRILYISDGASNKERDDRGSEIIDSRLFPATTKKNGENKTAIYIP